MNFVSGIKPAGSSRTDRLFSVLIRRVIEVVITSRTRNAVVQFWARGFESHTLRLCFPRKPLMGISFLWIIHPISSSTCIPRTDAILLCADGSGSGSPKSHATVKKELFCGIQHLSFYKFLKKRTVNEQFFIAAVSHDIPLIHHQDPVAVADRGETVGDHDSRTF